MLNFLMENLGTIIVSLIIIAIVAAIIIVRISNKKKGKSNCGYCAGCPSADICSSSMKNMEKHEKEN